jgi:hypothetical protein
MDLQPFTVYYLRLFNNSGFKWFEDVSCPDPRLRGDDGRSQTFVIPAKAGISGDIYREFIGDNYPKYSIATI